MAMNNKIKNLLCRASSGAVILLFSRPAYALEGPVLGPLLIFVSPFLLLFAGSLAILIRTYRKQDGRWLKRGLVVNALQCFFMGLFVSSQWQVRVNPGRSFYPPSEGVDWLWWFSLFCLAVALIIFALFLKSIYHSHSQARGLGSGPASLE